MLLLVLWVMLSGGLSQVVMVDIGIFLKWVLHFMIVNGIIKGALQLMF